MSDPKPITETQLRRMRPLMKAFTKLNAWVFKASNGRLMSMFSGCAICLVTMTGAKSGRRLDIPLMYVPFGEGVILVA
ncbi:MAG: nitroreductase/quinone reductase family protein, partial [Myxococcota bacterium]